MTKPLNNKGFSLVELLIAIAISSVILGAIVMSFTTSLKVFKDAKSISDNIETKTPSIELISRYFDRWGAGVVSQKEKVTCTGNCPIAQKSLSVTTTNDCSDVTFYGNLYGFGFVRDVVGTTSTAAKLISCRLDASQNHNCYTLWRDNTPLNEPSVDPGINLIPLRLVSLNTGNADCSAVTASTTQNATMDDDMSPSSGPRWKTVKAGDVIHRAAHRIRIYCSPNANDNNRRWLYVDLTDQYGSCTENESASPIAPVDSFNVQALPSGCNAVNGECKALSVSVTFRSQSRNYQGQFDTYTVTKVFGR